jgi:tetratricopeptide (TPR) repeat protein
LSCLLGILAGLFVASAKAAPDSGVDRQRDLDRLNVARDAYFKVIVRSDQVADAQAHEALADLERHYPGDPVAEAYRGSLELLDAAHSVAVWNLRKQSADGLARLDEAVARAPDQPEARFIRAATSWHLPGFYHRKAQCDADFAILAGRAEEDAREGKLPPELAAAAYDYWGQILVNRKDLAGAEAAFRTAVRIAPKSPAGMDAARRLPQTE